MAHLFTINGIAPAHRPACYNRPNFYPPGVWAPGCSAWFPGGNAERMKVNPDGGSPWSACDGCKQKIAAIVEDKQP